MTQWNERGCFAKNHLKHETRVLNFSETMRTSEWRF